jgi:hypothetical protein
MWIGATLDTTQIDRKRYDVWGHKVIGIYQINRKSPLPNASHAIATR